jgi:predicted nucleotidyltransferase
MKAREGDIVENTGGFMFDVKGFIHPPGRIIAFVRYFPDKQGERSRNGQRYSKIYSLSDRIRLIETRFPSYIVADKVFDEVLCEVPENEVQKVYTPIDALAHLREENNPDVLQTRVLQMADLLKEEARIEWSSLGVSGSVMVGLHNSNSDIDLLIYGSENCRRVQTVLSKELGAGMRGLRRLTPSELRTLFEFRSKDNAGSFEDFVHGEARKTCQGKFHGLDYFIRFVKDWNELHETYGEIQYRNAGYGAFEGTVTDDSEALFTPCAYTIESAKPIGNLAIDEVSEIVSFRGRFCEQAMTGEAIIAQGKVEEVFPKDERDYFRLLLGNRPSDYMILKH